MIEIDLAESAERLVRIDRLIETFRAAKQRRLLRRAIRLWRRAEARQRLVDVGISKPRVH